MPSSDEEHSGTLLETDEDIRRALQKNVPGQPVAVKQADPASLALKPSPQLPCWSPYQPTIRPPIAMLTVLDDGKSEGEVIRLRGDRFVIGRSEGDFLIPHDQLISSRHVEILRVAVAGAYRWVIADLQTRSGLFIRVSRTALVDKSEFLVGKGRFQFAAASSQAADTLDYLSVTPVAPKAPLDKDVARRLQPSLVQILPGGIGPRVQLSGPEHWIGTDPACLLCQKDTFVEPRHVRLYQDANGAWHAQNNKSANGLWFKVPQITVEEGCLFQIGEQRFRLKAGG